MSITNPGRARRLAAAAATLAIGAITLSACSGGSSQADDESAAGHEVTLQLSWIKNEEFAGEFLAEKNGYFSEAGFDSVELVEGPSTGVAELLSGQADIALSDAVSIGAAVASEDAPLKIVGATFQKNPFTILSLADGGDITAPEDLAGKKIGVQQSNTSLFNALLEANGIEPGEVEVVPVEFDPAPLTNGEVDGFFAYLTNESLTVELAGNEVSNLPLADNGLPFVAETVTVTDEYLQQNRDLLKDFLVAEIRGWADFLADPSGIAEQVVDEFGTDLDPAKTEAGALAQAELIHTDETAENGLFTISEQLQEESIASLAGAGHEATADELFDMSLLEEVYEEDPDLVEYSVAE